jgi:hypothetical protein
MLRVAFVFLLVVWAHGARADAALFDRLYESGDWRTLYAEIEKFDSAEALKARMDWLNGRVRAGAPHYLTVQYGRLIWALAGYQNNESGRDSGVAFVAAGVVAAAADAIKCNDQKAAEARAAAISRGHEELFDYAEKRPSEVRKQIRDLVLSIEVETADRRPLDPTLCEMNVPRADWAPILPERRREILRLIDALVPQD